MEAPQITLSEAVDFITPKTAIREFDLSKSKFYHWLNGGAFPSYRPRLPGEKENARTTFVRRSEVAAWIASGRQVV